MTKFLLIFAALVIAFILFALIRLAKDFGGVMDPQHKDERNEK